MKDFCFRIDCEETGNTMEGHTKKDKLVLLISDGCSAHDVVFKQRDIKDLIEALKSSMKQMNKWPFDG